MKMYCVLVCKKPGLKPHSIYMQNVLYNYYLYLFHKAQCIETSNSKKIEHIKKNKTKCNINNFIE